MRNMWSEVDTIRRMIRVHKVLKNINIWVYRGVVVTEKPVVGQEMPAYLRWQFTLDEQEDVVREMLAGDGTWTVGMLDEVWRLGL